MTRPVEGPDFISSCWTDIDARGYLVAAVEGGGDGCDWAYTVGLHLTAGHPELVLVGLDAAMAGGVLDTLGQRVVDGLELHVDEPVRMGPMALGLGEGGEQNAPLGRAVVGGLICATIATLFFVPTIFAFVHGRKAGKANTMEMQPSHV
jgi:hypothetical protein